jgi:hypothetical protein
MSGDEEKRTKGNKVKISRYRNMEQVPDIVSHLKEFLCMGLGE